MTCLFDTAGAMTVDHAVLYFNGDVATLPAGAPGNTILIENTNDAEWSDVADGLNLTFTITSTTDFASTASYLLDVGVAGQAPIPMVPASNQSWVGSKEVWTYTQPGVYRVQLIRRSGGQESRLAREIDVRNRSPRPQLTLANPDQDTRVTFSLLAGDEFDDYSQPESVRPTEYVVDYGDGTSETITAPRDSFAHVYPPSRGRYQTRLRVMDHLGQTGEVSTLVQVNNVPPQATFGINCNNLSTATRCTFDAANSFDPDGSITEYRWNIRHGMVVEQINQASPVLVRDWALGDADYFVKLEAVDNTGTVSDAVFRTASTRSVAATGLVYYAVEPCRVLDTRSAGGPIQKGSHAAARITGVCGIPEDPNIVAATVSVATIGPTAEGMLLAGWQGQDGIIAPFPATINRTTGTVVPLQHSSVGYEFFYLQPVTFNLPQPPPLATDIIVDVYGYYRKISGAPVLTSGRSVGPLRFRPLRPCVLTDTRSEPPGLAAGSPRLVTMAGCNLSAEAEAVVLGATILAPTTNGWLTAYPPSMPSVPSATVINAQAGVNLTNSVIARTSNLRVAFATSVQSANLVAATSGEFVRAGTIGAVASQYFPLRPCELWSKTPLKVAANGEVIYAADRNGFEDVRQVRGLCGIPATATAVAVRVAILAPSASGNVRIYPGDMEVPANATLNFASGADWQATTVYLPIAGDGQDLKVLVTTPRGDGTTVRAWAVGFFRP